MTVTQTVSERGPAAADTGGPSADSQGPETAAAPAGRRARPAMPGPGHGPGRSESG